MGTEQPSRSDTVTYPYTTVLLIVLVLAAGLPCLAEGAPPLVVEYIAHAAFRIEAADGSAIVIDPYAGGVWLSYDFPDGVEADAWLVSHPHYDHDGGEYRGMEPPWPAGSRVIRFPGEFDIGPFQVTGLAGRHAEPYGEEFDRFNTVWKIEIEGITLVHWGDNEPIRDPMAESLGEVDVLMLPIDAVEHLISFEAVDEIVDQLAPKILIPMHYRIPALEPSPDRPQDLGPIDPWLEDRAGVERLDSNRLEIWPRDLSQGGVQIRVLSHSPAVRPPSVRVPAAPTSRGWPWG